MKWRLLFLLALPLTMAAQRDRIPKFNARVDLVSLDVEVLDAAGNPVKDLVQDDFVVKENGKPMPITNFARLADKPVSLAILLDTSAIELKKLNIAKQFVFQIIYMLGRDDDICLYTLDNRDANLEVKFTKDRAPLVSALENISVPSKSSGGILHELLGGMPRTALGIDLALHSLRDSAHTKKALLVISNRFRGLGPVTVEHVQDSGCTLLTLGFDNKAAVIVSMGGDRISRTQMMRESGGRQFSGETEDVGGVSRAIAYSLKNYYSIAYQTEIMPGDEKPRHIKVLVPERKYTINARRSFIPK
jgi:VWFA-related protein